MTTFPAPPTRVLCEDDRVVFNIPKRLVRRSHPERMTYDVRTKYISDDDANSAIFDAISVDKHKFASDAYGYPAADGGCPECHEDDYDALTRLVLAIHRKLGTKFSAKATALEKRLNTRLRASKASIKKQLAALPRRARAAAKILAKDSDAFGCQRSNVIALVAALTGTSAKALAIAAHVPLDD